MKFLIQTAAAAGLLSLAACGGNTPAENAAENIREARLFPRDLHRLSP